MSEREAQRQAVRQMAVEVVVGVVQSYKGAVLTDETLNAIDSDLGEVRRQLDAAQTVEEFFAMARAETMRRVAALPIIQRER